MSDLEINWDQKRPGKLQRLNMWRKIHFKAIEDWSPSALNLKEQFDETHFRGGLQLHRYKVHGNVHFKWFALRNRLQEIDFLPKAINHPDLKNYRADLEIKGKAELESVRNLTDIFDLSSRLARLLTHGGANRSLPAEEAWLHANQFVEAEFGNRFKEVVMIEFRHLNADWFHQIAWDYSCLLYDKRHQSISLLNITDTD